MRIHGDPRGSTRIDMDRVIHKELEKFRSVKLEKFHFSNFKRASTHKIKLRGKKQILGSAGILMDPRGSPWTPRILMDPRGSPWTPRILMDPRGPRGPRGSSWIPVDPVDLHGSPWTSWILMDPRGSPWTSWILMDPRGSPWTPWFLTDPRGSLGSPGSAFSPLDTFVHIII